jgi:hypothetical protein
MLNLVEQGLKKVFPTKSIYGDVYVIIYQYKGVSIYCLKHDVTPLFVLNKIKRYRASFIYLKEAMIP